MTLTGGPELEAGDETCAWPENWHAIGYTVDSGALYYPTFERHVVPPSQWHMTVDGITYDRMHTTTHVRPMVEILGEDYLSDGRSRQRYDMPPLTDEQLTTWIQFGDTVLEYLRHDSEGTLQ